MAHLIHFHTRKVGGIRFITLGRISISFAVSSMDNWQAKLQAKMDAVTMRALIEATYVSPDAFNTQFGYEG